MTINPYAKDLQDGVHLRYLLRFCATSVAVREWQVLVNVMEVFGMVQEWVGRRGDQLGILGILGGIV